MTPNFFHNRWAFCSFPDDFRICSCRHFAKNQTDLRAQCEFNYSASQWQPFLAVMEKKNMNRFLAVLIVSHRYVLETLTCMSSVKQQWRMTDSLWHIYVLCMSGWSDPSESLMQRVENRTLQNELCFPHRCKQAEVANSLFAGVTVTSPELWITTDDADSDSKRETHSWLIWQWMLFIQI